MECFVSSILLEVPCFFFFLQFQLLFSDFYHFHHVIWGMKWAKKVKTKNGQNMSSGLFSHDAAHLSFSYSSLFTLQYKPILLLLLLSVWFGLHFEKPLCPSHPQVTVKS